jgi:diguanylate cyclase (GGDEF)-like protein/PAS domain S-box-containing protein
MKRFLKLFLPLAAVFLGVFWYVQDATLRSQRAIVEADEARTIALQAQTAESALNDIVTDLRILANNPEMSHYLEHWQNPEALKNLAVEFLNFATYKKRYDQIRFLDLQGMEIVRVNYYRDGRSEVVPQDQLQPKGDRYYFTETIDLEPGHIFISPLDLNMEQGVIEQPLKPMIRFGMPIFDQNGQRRGIVILNYLAQGLLDTLNAISQGLLGEFLLLNDEGYWLVSSDPDQEWGFMYPERKGRTFPRAFPEVWRRMTSTNSGQLQSPQGLFTFTTLFPRLLSQPRVNTGTAIMPDDPAIVAARQYHWRIVSHIPADVLHQRIYPPFLMILLIVAGGLSLLAALSWVIVRAYERRLQVIDALRESEVRLSNQLRFNQTLMDSIPAPVFFKDTEGRYLGCNAAYEEFTGIPVHQLAGKTVYEIAPHDLATFYQAQDQALFNDPGQQIYEGKVVFADGSKHDVIFRKNTFVDHEGHLSGLIGVMLDITERKRMEEQIRHMAQHDTLTGLPNRNLLQDRYQQCFYRAEREHRQFAILMMDLDGFKTVNDTLGHDMGDVLLQQVANRLEQCIRKIDTLCRLGGDEFIMLLGELHQREDATRVAETVLRTLNQPFILEQDRVARIGVSIGISLYPTNGATLDDLLKSADIAMYRAKKNGRNRYEFFAEVGESVTGSNHFSGVQ